MPEKIDPQTGYRYYSTRQFEVLSTIRYLRVSDMSLVQIADFLQNRDVERMEQKLRQQKEAVILKQQLPPGQCVRLRFRGSHAQAPVRYRRFMDYIETNHLQVDGFSREITMIDYGLTDDPRKFVTEISIPVKE